MRNCFGILTLLVIVFVLALAEYTAAVKKDVPSLLTVRRNNLTAEENVFYLSKEDTLR